MRLLASVIVPVHNGRGDDLRRLLAALERQTVPRDRFEVVIADDGSTDGTTDGLETADGWLRVSRGAKSNEFAVRNRAVAEARPSEVLAFTDSDCVPEPQWLEEGIRALEHADIAAGGVRFLLPRRLTVWTLLDIEMTKDSERQVLDSNAETANMFVKRELFERVGGWDGTLPNHGDFDFAERCVAAGGKLVFAPEALLWHPTRDRPRPLLRMVWVMNRWYAVRAARAGIRPTAVNFRSWVPVLWTIRARRRYAVSLGIDRKRMSENAVSPSLALQAAALPLIYLVLPYARAAAQLRGYVEGRRLR
jgi:GT2 family glycosyltransferase